METLIAAIGRIFAKIAAAMFGEILEHPVEETEEYNDVAQAGHVPDNPDDVFDASDW